jgi:hypothetical protein
VPVGICHLGGMTKPDLDHLGFRLAAISVEA